GVERRGGRPGARKRAERGGRCPGPRWSAPARDIRGQAAVTPWVEELARPYPPPPADYHPDPDRRRARRHAYHVFGPERTDLSADAATGPIQSRHHHPGPAASGRARPDRLLRRAGRQLGGAALLALRLPEPQSRI